MTLFHAVVLIDHQSAQVFQFDAAQVQVQKVQAHQHDTGQHGSKVRTEHEFFGEVCDALADIKEVLVTGSQTALSDFRHYVEKHRSPVAPQIVDWQTVNHPTDAQLVALARQFFDQRGKGAAPSA